MPVFWAINSTALSRDLLRSLDLTSKRDSREYSIIPSLESDRYSFS